MLDINRARSIFIKEDTPLPSTLSIDNEEFLPGWRVVKNIDSDTLARKIEGAHWNFFCLAGEIRSTVLGRDRPGTLRRAVKSLLAKREGQKFNCLEITKIVSKRFLGIPLMSVSANSRHIQESIYLLSAAKDSVLRMPVAVAPKSGLDSGEEQHCGDVATKQYMALISNS